MENNQRWVFFIEIDNFSTLIILIIYTFNSSFIHVSEEWTAKLWNGLLNSKKHWISLNIRLVYLLVSSHPQNGWIDRAQIMRGLTRMTFGKVAS